MSDERLRELERKVREGDESARLLLTSERVRARKGLLVAWDTDDKRAHASRGRRKWVERQATVSLLVDQLVPRRDGKPRKRPIKWRRFALAVLDLEDLYRVTGPSGDDLFELIDLSVQPAEFASEDQIESGHHYRRYRPNPFLQNPLSRRASTRIIRQQATAMQRLMPLALRGTAAALRIAEMRSPTEGP